MIEEENWYTGEKKEKKKDYSKYPQTKKEEKEENWYTGEKEKEKGLQ